MKFLIFLSIFFYSCSSYNLTRRVNPFKKYGVRSISVPMFYNQTNLSNVTHHFTRHFTHLLYELKDIDVKSSTDKKVDAYLIGILKSPNKLVNTLVADKVVDVASVAPVSVTNELNSTTRNALVPSESKMNLTLEVYLIRRTELTKGMVYQIRANNFPNLAEKNDAIILKEIIPISRNFEREIFDKVKDGSNNILEDNSIVNSTQNRGILEKTIAEEAKKAADRFKNIIFYAF